MDNTGFHLQPLRRKTRPGIPLLPVVWEARER
jgi:hypothetical protein